MEVKKTLEEVQIRHQELMKLEKSIMELKTLFVEMALLVEQQVRIFLHILYECVVETKKGKKYIHLLV